ncbi:MAG: tRNA pseudouridine(55) synthase TruB [Candidatus Nealsonbacteria bacterium]|nr:tRNA pseudouridine(55) synthase TruB [Candidatus Nealsonbacteria bacterium]
MAICGIFNVNKTGGMTSRRVVDLVQGAVRPAKVGHAGTLDPLATGVLVVCVGAATRLIEYVQRMPKDYTGTFLLGRHSPTEDVDGDVVELDSPPVPTLEQIVAASRLLVGRIEQRPPAYSALKVAGRRAYKLARQGKKVDLQPRPIDVYRLDVQSYDYPELKLRIQCGSGTYVRSLGRDLAESLGTAAVMSALVRTAIGEFHVEDAAAPQEITSENCTEHLLPALRAVQQLPRVELSAGEISRIANGQSIPRETQPPDAKEIAAVDDAGRLVAILTHREPGVLRPLRNFPAGGS